MKSCRLFLILSLFSGVFFGLIFAPDASAETVIADNAYLFTDEETQEIQKECDQVYTYTATGVMIVTTDDTDSDPSFTDTESHRAYADRIIAGQDAQKDWVVLFLSAKEKSRTGEIFCYGNANTRLTDARISKISKHMESALLAGDYSTAIETFCDEVTVYLEREPYLDTIWFHPLFHLALCLVAAAAIVGWLLRGARFS